MIYLEGIRLDYETADIITRLSLIDSLKSTKKLIARIEKQPATEDHTKEDLAYDLKYCDALLVVIAHFSTTEQMTELFVEVNEEL